VNSVSGHENFDIDEIISILGEIETTDISSIVGLIILMSKKIAVLESKIEKIENSKNKEVAL
jgi:hypothetical protein